MRIKSAIIAFIAIATLSSCGSNSKKTTDTPSSEELESIITDTDETAVEPEEIEMTEIELTEEELTDDTEPGEESSDESNWEKTKGVYNAAKDKLKKKNEKWKEEHSEQIEHAKEKGSEIKEKTKKKVGNLLDRARQKLEED